MSNSHIKLASMTNKRFSEVLNDLLEEGKNSPMKVANNHDSETDIVSWETFTPMSKIIELIRSVPKDKLVNVHVKPMAE